MFYNRGKGRKEQEFLLQTVKRSLRGRVMRRRKRRSVPSRKLCCLGEEKQHNLLAWWSLKILLDLRGWKKLKRDYSGFTSNLDILIPIGLEHLEDKELDKKQFLEILEKQKETLKHHYREPNKNLDNNIKKIADYIGLSDVERQLLLFAVLLEENEGLQEVTDTLGELNAEGVVGVLSEVLDLPHTEVREALSRKSLSSKSGLLNINKTYEEKFHRELGKSNLLTMSGLLKLKRNSMNEMRYKLDLLGGFAEALQEPEATVESLLQNYFASAGKPELTKQDYLHVEEHYTLIQAHLEQVCAQQIQGVNILVYGPPGTGKTEFAKSVTQTLGFNLYEVNIGDEENPFSKPKRIRAFQLAQQVLARQKNALVLFDEIDSLLEENFSFFMRDDDSLNLKAWINRNLEQNPVPAIWIANNVQFSETAFIRRFDIVFNLENPPRSTRLKILSNALKDIPVSQIWLERLADNKHIAPAVIAKAASVIRCQKQQTSAQIEQKFEQLLESTLVAMGYPRESLIKAPAQIKYQLDVVNPDHDLNGIIQGLKRQGEGRLCLYGPPGTGKTEFGHYLARQLDKPLLVKRSSDILGPYIGETEANIAKMFHEANYEDAVLLLDEADSFLRERSEARRSWEVTQVNELLTQMERYDGVFVCSTNLMDSLDTASLRRFDLKIKFDFLKPKQSWQLFFSVLTDQGVKFTRKEYWKRELAKYSSLTPGDFATVVRKSRISSEQLSPESLLEGLAKEVVFKRPVARGIGFLTSSKAA